MFKNKIVLITGGAGFIGSHIVEKCLELGAEKVISYDNLIEGSPLNHAHLKGNDRFQFIQGDINDSSKINPLLDRAQVVFNEAASKLVVSLKDPFIDLQTNTIANFKMLEHLRNSSNNPRIIHASTGSVFGSADKPFKEEDAKNPSTAYGISKLAAENYYQLYYKDYGIKSTVLRYFHVFGPRQNFTGEAGVVSIFLSQVLQNKPPVVFGTGDQIRCLTHVQDDVQANILLYKNNSTIGQSYNVASKTRLSVLELAKKITERYGQPGLQVKFGPPRKGENIKPIPNTSKIEALGFRESITFDQGLEETKKYVETFLKGNQS